MLTVGIKDYSNHTFQYTHSRNLLRRVTHCCRDGAVEALVQSARPQQGGVYQVWSTGGPDHVHTCDQTSVSTHQYFK